MGSRRTFLLIAAAAIAAPTVAFAQDTGTRIIVIGAMQEQEHIFVTGAMQDREQRVTVIGAAQEQEHIFVTGATQDREQHVSVIGAMQDREPRITAIGAVNDEPAGSMDRSLRTIPVVYEDEPAPAPAPARAPARTDGPATPVTPSR